MSKYIRYFFTLICCLLSGLLFAKSPGDEVTEKAYRLLKETIEQNRQNDLAGYSYRNNYVIEINLDPNWVEERGNGTKVFASKYESISQRLNTFNSQRTDKLRAYVVVVNDWELRLKQHVNIDFLPSTVKLDAISGQAEANQIEEKKRIENELNQVPLDVQQKLKNAGYTDMAICFGAKVKFYTVDTNGTPAARGYKYSTVVLSGEKLKANKEAIRAKIKTVSSATLESDMELKVFSLTDGIKEVVDQQKPFALANKVSNATINDWYTSVGGKTTDPFSGVTTDKQVYDYTGVFSSLTKEIINQLPDPTAKVVITDNLTSDNIIDNIKAQVAKPLSSNVFWFHLDRKGELHTQLFLAQTVKERLGKQPGNISGNLDLYIGKLYKEAGPKIKSPADLIDFLNIEAKVFKALNSVLAGAEIPKEWWDSSHPDYLLGVWGKYISPQTGITFAYVCGVWNGVIGNLSMVGSLLSLKSELQGVFWKVLVDDTYREELFADIQFYTTNIGTLMELGYEMVKTEISKKVDEEWEKLKNGDATSIAYVGGLATVEVIIAVYTAGAVEAVKAGLMSFRLIRIPVEFLTKIGKFMLRPVVYIFKAGGKILWDGTKYLLKQGDEIIASFTAEGKLIIYRMLAATEKVVDEIPIPQGIVRMDANGNAIGDISFARTESGWGFKKRSEFLEALSKSLANYPTLRDKVLTLTKEFQGKFIDDFLKNADENILKSLDGNPVLVDGWKKLVDASEVIKKNIYYLEYAASWPTSWKVLKSGDDIIITGAKGKQLGTLYNNRIVASGRTLSGESGNALLNKVPLMKNIVYDVGDIIYMTDDFGRVVKTNADLDDVVRIRLGGQQVKSVDIKDGVRGSDQGGHIIGSRFFGPGEQINLYPQSANLNQGAWKQMENTWAEAIADKFDDMGSLIEKGKDVRIQVEAVFEGSSLRPEAFEVNYWIDGVKTQRTFINQ